jgi:hypothetical protein
MIKSSCKTKHGVILKAKYARSGDLCQADDVCGEGVPKGTQIEPQQLRFRHHPSHKYHQRYDVARRRVTRASLRVDYNNCRARYSRLCNSQ